MTKKISIHRALLSVSNKTGIVDFARALHEHGVEIISTGGTAKTISSAGIPVTPVDEVTGFPEMLDGRVKTLHPMIHGGLLGVRDNTEHQNSMKEYGILPIDLVCIDLYPFEKTIEDCNATEAEVIEQIDIGGPSMIRSAAKNFKFVTVITNIQQYQSVLTCMDENNASTTLSLRRNLANTAFARTAAYDKTISQWMAAEDSDTFELHGELVGTLRYGENPNQDASVFKDPSFEGVSIIDAETTAAKAMSYNNYMDAAAALELVQDLHAHANMPSVAIIKHANPCGASINETIELAFEHAWKCDPLAAFGGIVAVSEPVTDTLASLITKGQKFLEVIVAPSFTPKATGILLEKWKNIRLVSIGTNDRAEQWTQLKSVQGGFLTQTCSPLKADSSTWEHVAGPQPTTQQLLDGSIAWICAGHLKSNSISIVDQGALIGGGMGQVDRVSASNLAVLRAGGALKEASNAVAASDAFFPFPDGPKILIDAGVTCIVQPGGSVRDHETIELCSAQDITLLHTGIRCFKH